MSGLPCCSKCGRRPAFGERWAHVIVARYGDALRIGDGIEGHVECVADDVAALLVQDPGQPKRDEDVP